MRSEVLETIPASIPPRNTGWYFRDTFFSHTVRAMNNADDDELRRDALRRLIAEKADGNVSRFCEPFEGANPVYIRAIVKKGSKKPFGEKAAKGLELSLGLPEFALRPRRSNDVVAEIESAIKRAGFLDSEEKEHWLGLAAMLKTLQKKRQ
jgi:hypothetical protein